MLLPPNLMVYVAQEYPSSLSTPPPPPPPLVDVDECRCMGVGEQYRNCYSMILMFGVLLLISIAILCISAEVKLAK